MFKIGTKQRHISRTQIGRICKDNGNKNNKKNMNRKKVTTTGKYKCNLILFNNEGCFRYQTLQHLSCYERL